MSITGVETKNYLRTDKDKSLPGTSGTKNQPPNKKQKTDNDSNKQQTVAQYNITTGNRFDLLSSSEDEDEEQILIKQHRQARDQKQPKPPPIVLYSYIENHTYTINNMKKDMTGDIQVKNKGNRLIVYTENRKDYDKLTAIIQQSKLEYHTYTPKEDRQHKLVIKNLPPNISCQEIKDDLVTKGISIINITQMTKKLSDNTIKSLPLYIATINNTNQLKDVYKIKIICHCVVQWEKYHNKNPIVQCFKCQAFGHVAINCHKTQKCGFCSGIHNSKECKTKENLKCSNCNSNHAANDKNCPIYVRQLNGRQITRQSQPRQNYNPNTYRYNVDEFPQLNNGNGIQQEQSGPTWVNPANHTGTESISDLIMLAKSFLQTINVSKIIFVIKNTLVKLNNTKDNFLKLGILLESITELIG